MTAATLRPVGTRIRYTGDVANLEGVGEIIAHREADRFAPASYDVRLDDGREMLALWPGMFEPSPGRRFWFLDEWEADQAARIERMRQEMQEVLNANR